MGKYPLRIMFIRRQHQKSDADPNRCQHYAAHARQFRQHTLRSRIAIFMAPRHATFGEISLPLIGANHIITRCRLLVVREHTPPMTQRSAIARRTVCNAELEDIEFHISRNNHQEPEFRLRGKCVLVAVESGVHANRSKNHLADGVCHARNSGCLAQEVAPTDNPGPESDVFLRNNMLCNEIHAACCWIRRHQLRNYEALVT